MLPSQCRVLFRKCSCSLPFVTFVTNSFLLFCSLCQACGYKYFQRSFLEPTTLFTPPQTSNQEIFKKNMRYSPAYTLFLYSSIYTMCTEWSNSSYFQILSFLLKYIDLQCFFNFCCTAQWPNLIQFPVLFSRTSMPIHFKCNSLHPPTQNSLSLPLPPPPPQQQEVCSPWPWSVSVL